MKHKFNTRVERLDTNESTYYRCNICGFLILQNRKGERFVSALNNLSGGLLPWISCEEMIIREIIE